MGLFNRTNRNRFRSDSNETSKREELSQKPDARPIIESKDMEDNLVGIKGKYAGEMFEKVKAILTEQLEKEQSTFDTIVWESSLIEDLGMTSLSFVDLTIAIEKRLGIAEFTMQDWLDEESIRKVKRFTVGSLVFKCIDIISPVSGHGNP